MIILTIHCHQRCKKSPNAHVATRPSLTTTRYDGFEMQNGHYLGHTHDQYPLQPPPNPAPPCSYLANRNMLSAEYAQPYEYSTVLIPKSDTHCN